MQYKVKIGDSTYKVEAKDYQDAINKVKVVHERKQVKDAGQLFAIQTENDNRIGEWYVRASNKEEAFEKIKQQSGHKYDRLISSRQISEQSLNGKNVHVIDDAYDRSTIEALISDEKAAIDAYNVAIANLDGKISDLGIKVLQNIRDDEETHVENLMSILTGDITEKNLQDSRMKDEAEYVQSNINMMQKAADDKDWQRVANLAFNLISSLKRDKLAK